MIFSITTFHSRWNNIVYMYWLDEVYIQIKVSCGIAFQSYIHPIINTLFYLNNLFSFDLEHDSQLAPHHHSNPNSRGSQELSEIPK